MQGHADIFFIFLDQAAFARPVSGMPNVVQDGDVERLQSFLAE